MDFSDSEEDESDNQPRVTSLDQPGKVTIGSDGSLDIGKSNSLPLSQPRTQSLAASAQRDNIPTVSGGVSGDAIDISNLDISTQQGNEKKVHKWRDQLAHNGGEHSCTAKINQLDIILPIYWSQDQCTITLRLGFPSSIFPPRGIRVRVKGALKYADRFSAVGTGVMSGNKDDTDGYYGEVEIVSKSTDSKEETVLLTGKLPRPIHLNQDEDEIDFEMEDNLGNEGGGSNNKSCDKLVTIIMPKAVPMMGMIIWWDCPLVGYPQIDVSTIQDRQKGKGNATSSTSNTEQHESKDERKEAFQKAWEEAHQMFREKMKTKQKQSIDIDD